MNRDKITPEKKAEIRAAAEKATKGPWKCYKDITEGKWFDVRNNDVKIVSPHAHKGCEEDFQFIALTDPNTVIALLDALDSAEKPESYRLRKLDAENKRLRKCVTEAINRLCPCDSQINGCDDAGCGTKQWLDKALTQKGGK